MNDLEQYIDWFIWRTTQNHDIPIGIVKISDYDILNSDNIYMCIPFIFFLKYYEKYDPNNSNIDKIREAIKFHLNEYRHLRVRSNVDKYAHIHKCVYDRWEFGNIDKLKDIYSSEFKYLNIDEETTNDIAQSIINELDNTINIVVDNTKEIVI